MNGDNASNASLLDAILNGLAGLEGCDILVCPPSLYVATVAQRLNGTLIAVGAQDVSIQEKGAFTGENSAGMLRDVGASYVLVGHSERRQYHHETDNLVGEKAQAALAKGVTPIVCIGETLAEREAGETNAVVKRQLAAAVHAVGHCVSEIVVAYEPVWAIGTGKTATPAMAQEVHAFIRSLLVSQFGAETAGRVRILYGGSMKPDNADALLAEHDIDGGLIGGASLEAKSFVDLVQSAAKSLTR